MQDQTRRASLSVTRCIRDSCSARMDAYHTPSIPTVCRYRFVVSSPCYRAFCFPAGRRSAQAHTCRTQH